MANSEIRLTSAVAANIPTPTSGRISFFADASNGDKPSVKLDTGSVIDLTASTVVSNWTKYTINYTDFQPSTANIGAIALFTLGANEIVSKFYYEYNTRFDALSMSDLIGFIGISNLNAFELEKNGNFKTAAINLLDFDEVHQRNNIIAGVGVPSPPTEGHVISFNIGIDSEPGLGNTYTPLTNSYEVTEIITVADVAGSLGGKYFTYDDGGGAYYIWYNTGSSVDPAIVGKTGLMVDISVNDSAVVVMQKTAAFLWNDGSLGASIYTDSPSNRMILQDSDMTNYTDATAGDSGFTVTTKTQGGGAVKNLNDLTQGSIDIWIEKITVA